jgi:voltage-gated potassium channel Kch
MDTMKRYFRDIFIILSAIWINVILFFILMILSAGLLKLFGNHPQASWLELLLDAFHFSTIERVDTGGEVVPLLLAFILPILSAIILGEGILRVFSIYMQRRVNRKEWDLMVVNTYKDHAVICGVGEMGQQLLRRLAIEQPKMEMVLIDPRPGLLAEMGFMNDRIIHIQGNMTDMDMLKQVNLPLAKMIILTAGEDALNLETAYKVLQLNPEIPIWIRLHRSGLAALLDLSRKPQIHFFCPYQQAAESIMNHIMERNVAESR